MNVRHVFKVIAASVFVLQSLTINVPAQQRFDGVTLRVATYGGPWGDGMKKLIGPEFAKLGGTLEIVTGAPAGHLAKLIVARGKEPPFDLCEVDEPATPNFIRASVLQKFDVSKLPNASGLISPITQDGHLVPDWVFQDGVVYNADKFKELGIPAPKRYSDLLDPRLKGRVGVPNISGGLGLFVVYGFTIDAGGSVTNIKPGLENLKKLGATQYFSGNLAAQTALIAGDIWANFMGSSWAIRLRRAHHDWAKFALLKVGDDVGLWERGHLGLAKNSRNVEAAHWFVNELISPKIQLELAKRAGNVPVNKQAIAELDKDPLAHEILRLDPKDIAKMRRVDFGTIDVSAWREEWNRTMLH
jgi:putative spermidine/putrescine transport system substrate-binding protein